MNQEVELGKAVYGRSGGSHGWFHIEDNKDNIYRVLPPMKSLAREGKYAKYYSTHRGFRGTDNKQKPFLCVEEGKYDAKTKTKAITVHCPVCDWVSAIEQQIASYKAQGATDDQIREYRNKYVFPFQAERKYYLNVVNAEGKIGVLPIGSNMFKSLEALALEQQKAGRDITGMEGYYINFKKQTKYKGDRDAIHTASLYMAPQQDGSYRPVVHVIDTAFAQRLGPEAADLGQLFKTLEIEQLSQLIALEGEARAKYVDSLFPKEQVAPTAAAQTSPVTQPAPASVGALPGFNAAPAATLPPPTQQFGQPAAPAPAAPAATTAAPMSFTPPANALPNPGTAAPGPLPQTFTPPANAAPQQGPAAPGFAGFGQQAAPAAPISQLDDAQFANMVRPLKG